MGLSGFTTLNNQLGRVGGLSSLDTGIETVQHQGRVGSPLVQPLNNLLFLKVDDNWLAQHPGFARDYDQTLTLTFVDLEAGIPESSQPNYGDVDVIGRSEAYKIYGNTSSKEVALTFQFRAQNLDGVDVADALQREVVKPARFLDALKYPITDENTGISYAPPPILLQIGNLLLARAVVTSAELTWQSPFDPDSLLPHGAEVACTFTIVRSLPGNYLVQGGPIDGVWK